MQRFQLGTTDRRQVDVHEVGLRCRVTPNYVAHLLEGEVLTGQAIVVQNAAGLHPNGEALHTAPISERFPFFSRAPGRVHIDHKHFVAVEHGEIISYPVVDERVECGFVFMVVRVFKYGFHKKLLKEWGAEAGLLLAGGGRYVSIV
ncbi:hypothetical protein PG984_006953 [Apiospora sp. TS-2023a]